MLYDFVAEGGGIKLIGLIGAIAAIEEEGFIPSHAAGTSAGAIIAASRVAGYSPRELWSIVQELEIKKVRDKGFWFPFRSGLNLIKDFGLYKGDYFYEFIKEKLEQKGVKIFGDLRSYNKQDSNSIKLRWRFKCYAADVTRGRLITLPHDLPHLYGLDADKFEVAKAIRCSMSIPIFYQPMKIKESFVVDGGLISNFPINAFDVEEEPPWPTFGLLLDEHPSTKINSISKLFHTFLIALIKTMLSAHDKTLIEPLEYLHRTIKIPTGTVSSTDFDLSNDQQQWLYKSGYDAAHSFLRHWSWTKYREWATALRSKQSERDDFIHILEPKIINKAREIMTMIEGKEYAKEAIFNLIRLKMKELINDV